MFQTEVHLFLQAHAGPLWHTLMWGLSELATTPIYILVLIVVTFGHDLRRGWLLGQALLWTAGAAQLGKNFFALPRPVDVDSRVVELPAGTATQQLFTARGADELFGGLPRDVVDYYRALGGVDWGLPSGHTSVFSAFCGSAAMLLWRRRWWRVTAAAAAVMGLSRMTLGRHFLADVLAGALLGAGAVFALRRLVGPEGGVDPLLESPSGDAAAGVSRPGFAAAAALAPALLLPLAFSDGEVYAAQLWGWNLGFWLLVRRRRYAGGSARQRGLRVLLGLLLAALCLAAPALVAEKLGGAGDPAVDLAVDLALAFVGVLVLVVGTVRLAERLGLYDRPTDGEGGAAAAPASDR